MCRLACLDAPAFTLAFCSPLVSPAIALHGEMPLYGLAKTRTGG